MTLCKTVMGITMTERAAREFKKIVSEQQLPKETYLRVTITGGGCSGFTYVLDFADKPAETDKVCRTRGVAIVCDPKSFMYLEGTTIEFKDGLISRGFIFNNPNAQSTCECGMSFAV